MPRRTSPLDDTDRILAALDASGVVGVWTHDVWADRIAVSTALADVLGLAPDTAAAGIPRDVFLATILDEDRLRVENALHASIEAGGTFEIAFRTVCGERRLGFRGRIFRDGSGRRIRGLGIAIDHTEESADQNRPERHAEQAVNRMAEHAIALHDLAAGLHQPRLVSLLESLMREIGFTLAGHLERGERRRSH
ncbi:PAS domain-containing protein [Methylobacterium marchantiae]|uniref:PAS domain-containing protein n=1 Tax=Methylobacterium marchantiae TaxID=600331 RepID=A0ABW3WX89_9HYPH|nr:hypothetical protein AIGOOFII_0114 [Methylobacterium marchantiae]